MDGVRVGRFLAVSVLVAGLLVAGTPAVANPAGAVLDLGTALGGDAASAVDGRDVVVRYGWPVAAPHPVLRPFVAPSSPYGPGHRGVDLGAADGAPVFAAGDGVVAFAGQVAGQGVVSVQHGDGVRTTYLPVAATVHRGDRVRGGDLIGHLRQGHDCSARAGPAAVCLHWGARRGAPDTEYLDPLGLLAQGRVRLLPWREPP